MRRECFTPELTAAFAADPWVGGAVAAVQGCCVGTGPHAFGLWLG